MTNYYCPIMDTCCQADLQRKKVRHYLTGKKAITNDFGNFLLLEHLITIVSGDFCCLFDNFANYHCPQGDTKIKMRMMQQNMKIF